ncbi:DNA (cytosine-5-)-methyltransferase [Fodinicurvata sp. EGI_FJ10296]|uniref:DNA (cytosine-5-)-methyltransferase n=1 Tax=Fodinicurvata sp. EGI_FJ10296 TaxID=3231908 RepID=UPI0034553417
MSAPAIRYLSVCSGIEAATVAWHPLGWLPVAFAEVDRFASALLASRYPAVPNHGDMTRYKDWPDHAIDLLVGGTPCQSFSIAGQRAGLVDPRGNLALVYLALAARYRPRWLVWENVPGVLSSKGGRDFGAFIGQLAECGYHAAWRVLDAQYIRVDGFRRAVPQRRRRVILVGHLGDWRRAAAVLFDRESLHGNSPPRRKAWQEGPSAVGGGPEGGSVSGTVSSKWAKGSGGPAGDEMYNMVAQPLAPTLSSRPSGGGGFGTDLDVDGGSIAFNSREELVSSDQVSGALGAGSPQAQAVAFQERGRADGRSLECQLDIAYALTAPSGGGRAQERNIATQLAVRRLTPTECERLQGFPDGYTDAPYRRRNWTPDGPRYKALGNSMAVNVMRWIGRRIEMVERIASGVAL